MSEPIKSWPYIRYVDGKILGKVETIIPPEDFKIMWGKNIKTLTFEKEGGKKITIPIDKFLDALEALK